MLRIFPLYYGYLLLLLGIAVPWSGKTGIIDSPNVREIADQQSWLWLYGTNIWLTLRGSFVSGFVDGLWSLAIEEHFYLLWPWFVVCWVRKERLSWLCLTVVFIAIVSRVLCVVLSVPLGSYLLTPCRVDSLALGALLAVSLRSGRLPRLSPGTVVWGWRLGLVGIVVVLLLRPALPLVSVAYEGVGKSLTAVVFVLLLWVAVQDRSPFERKVLSHPVVRALGKYSYALYLFHVPVWLLARRAYGVSALQSWSDWAMGPFLMEVVLPFALSLGLAYGSWYLYEARFLRMKRHFCAPGQPPRGTPAHHDGQG